MIIDCISDLHGYYPELEGGDLLIVAGDLTLRDLVTQHLGFSGWLANQSYEKIILIAGNHDGQMTDWKPLDQYNLSYLQDSGTEYKGFKIWGSPWTPTFLNWYFMKDRGMEIKQEWDKIPVDVDILITHGPPYGILDQCEDFYNSDQIVHVGCEELRNQLDSGRIKPKLHVFGHIHEGYGKQEINGTIFVNASIMNEKYKPVNKPIRIVI